MGLGKVKKQLSILGFVQKNGTDLVPSKPTKHVVPEAKAIIANLEPNPAFVAEPIRGTPSRELVRKVEQSPGKLTKSQAVEYLKKAGVFVGKATVGVLRVLCYVVFSVIRQLILAIFIVLVQALLLYLLSRVKWRDIIKWHEANRSGSPKSPGKPPTEAFLDVFRRHSTRTKADQEMADLVVIVSEWKAYGGEMMAKIDRILSLGAAPIETLVGDVKNMASQLHGLSRNMKDSFKGLTQRMKDRAASAANRVREQAAHTVGAVKEQAAHTAREYAEQDPHEDYFTDSF